MLQPFPNAFPIIEVDKKAGRGNGVNGIVKIRYNNDDRSVLSGAKNVRVFYEALREWTRILKAKENEVWINLQPGLAVMVDNWRVLHGRSAFTGHRRMVGSYHGMDDYRSRYRVVVEGAKQRDNL